MCRPSGLVFFPLYKSLSGLILSQDSQLCVCACHFQMPTSRADIFAKLTPDIKPSVPSTHPGAPVDPQPQCCAQTDSVCLSPNGVRGPPRPVSSSPSGVPPAPKKLCCGPIRLPSTYFTPHPLNSNSEMSLTCALCPSGSHQVISLG